MKFAVSAGTAIIAIVCIVAAIAAHAFSSDELAERAGTAAYIALAIAVVSSFIETYVNSVRLRRARAAARRENAQGTSRNES
ncbi:MAG: hypothetical protein JO199_12095 [Candidatus Eremiobacteraeota bacterium]|nr:hypothetical protein [Candidatus Eremiobacteraeota bacterium]